MGELCLASLVGVGPGAELGKREQKVHKWKKIRIKKNSALFLFLCILFHPGRSNNHTIAVLPCLILVEDTQPGYIALEQAQWPNLIVLM